MFSMQHQYDLMEIWMSLELDLYLDPCSTNASFLFGLEHVAKPL